MQRSSKQVSSGDATTVPNRESTVASDFTAMSNAVVAKKSVYDSST
jgi:hypothetical protein